MTNSPVFEDQPDKVFKGQVENGKPHGKGEIFSYANDSCEVGFWVNGKKNGFFKIFTRDYIYEYEFKNDVKHGLSAVYTHEKYEYFV